MPPVGRSASKRQSQASPRTRKNAQVRRKVATSAPGKPARKKAARSFGRRSKRPPSRFQRFMAALRENRFASAPAAFVTGFLLVAVTLYGLAVGGHFAAFGSTIVTGLNGMVASAGFSVEDITVSGRSRTPNDAIRRALDAPYGASMLSVDLDAARARLEALDWVEEAHVTRFWPNRIHVQIVEREPYAIWQRGGRLALIDKQGNPITESNIEAYGHLPFVVGHGAAREAAAFQEMLAEWPELRARVRAAVRVGGRRWNLKLENDINVMLPEDGVARALGELSAIEASYRVLARDIEAIDLRLADRFTIRLTDEAAARRAASGANEFDVKPGKGSST